MAFEIIKDINESRLFPSKSSYKSFSVRTLSETTFLYFLGLQILRSETEFRSRIKTYSTSVLKWNNFDNEQSTGNDLYQLLYVLNKVEFTKTEDVRLQKRIFIPQAAIFLWLRTIGDTPSEGKDHRFLYELEDKLSIDNSSYKALRRMIESWSTLNYNQKSAALTRLIQAFEAKASRSEILDWLKKLAKNKALELKNVDNAETGEKVKKTTFDYWNIPHQPDITGLGFNKWVKK
jgi:hypothetical protein